MEPLLAMAAWDLLGKPVWAWGLFALVVVGLLAFDLGILNRRDRVIGVAESLWLSAFYILAAFAFGGWVWSAMGADVAITFYTGYLIEKSLSLDNVFVISLIFAHFAVPREYQHRVLFWGVIGVVVARGIMIGVGTALVNQFEWVLWVFGAFLALTGAKMLFGTAAAPDVAGNPGLALIKCWLPVTDRLHGSRFVVRAGAGDGGGEGGWRATPLLLALITIECADVIFAVDSVPAIFAVTTDPYVVYTSNIFAILGLRALYFALAAMIHRFAMLKYALAFVLLFIGGKIFWSQMYGKVDPAISLGITAALLAGGVIASLARPSDSDGRVSGEGGETPPTG